VLPLPLHSDSVIGWLELLLPAEADDCAAGTAAQVQRQMKVWVADACCDCCLCHHNYWRQLHGDAVAGCV
jgi:hypothetical protein